MYHAQVCNMFAGPIFASLRLRTAKLLSKKMLQRRRAVGNNMSDVIGDLNLRPTAPEPNALPLDQLSSDFYLKQLF